MHRSKTSTSAFLDLYRNRALLQVLLIFPESRETNGHSESSGVDGLETEQIPTLTKLTKLFRRDITFTNAFHDREEHTTLMHSTYIQPQCPAATLAIDRARTFPPSPRHTCSRRHLPYSPSLLIHSSELKRRGTQTRTGR